MSPRAIDANILLRFVTGDHPEMSPRCRDLLARVGLGEEEVYLPEAALCDAVWTLRSFYRWPPDRISAFVGDLLALEGLRMGRKPMIWLSLELFREGKIDFSDALIAAEMASVGAGELYSFDRDFDSVAGVARVEP
ncbi:MAG TPA: type II toxin-antitoxin system VapC family toxin [Thermoanaerobaculia bacterium]|nr:type II toxin-antitoxin system VapC family toxin [Thermoanaerobaculia bacterium]